MNTISAILEPIIAKSMQVKGYSRDEATQKAEQWLAGELKVNSLSNLDYEQVWTAEAIVERAMLPPPKKHKKKVEVPKEAARYFAFEPMGEEYWERLKAVWGEEFFRFFFGEQRESTALLSPGQQPQREWSKSELILVG